MPVRIPSDSPFDVLAFEMPSSELRFFFVFIVFMVFSCVLTSHSVNHYKEDVGAKHKEN